MTPSSVLTTRLLATPPHLSSAPASFVLWVYNWDSAHDREPESPRAFSTLSEAEQAYTGRQDAAEIAIIEAGELKVISRSVANRGGRRATPAEIQWSREREWQQR